MSDPILLPRVVRLENTVDDHGRRLDKVEDKIDDHEYVIYGKENCPGLVPRVAAVERATIEMKIYSRILFAIGSGLGLLIMGLLWDILTHKITLIY